MFVEMVTDVLNETLMITGFVFVMMLVMEYLNVLTGGGWDKTISRHPPGQIIFASLLGATPGCLGAFAVVSLYSHGVITFGALVAAMIATCGDETFVMLALFPGKAISVLAVLFAGGIAAGVVVDAASKRRRTEELRYASHYVAVHPGEDVCIGFSRHDMARQWKHCSAHRGWLATFLSVFILGVASGEIGHYEWNWVRITLLAVGLIGLFIVVTVPEHFLEEHLWKHIVRVHVWRVFLWTLGALLAVHVLLDVINMDAVTVQNRLLLLSVACLIGVVPVSGPHLVFVMLYAEGSVPFSILLASCVVQDGHGMIPLLAHSGRAFVVVKTVNFAIGFLAGLAGWWMGW